MSRVFIDTNFLLDLAVRARPGADDAAKIFDAVVGGKATALLAPSSLKDFYYVARHDIDENTRRAWISLFLDSFEIFDFNARICDEAVRSDEPDFEDGLIRAAAEVAECEFIISRDESAFVSSAVRRVDARQFLDILAGK
jgi:predicted nucleic acid-binding protein